MTSNIFAVSALVFMAGMIGFIGSAIAWPLAGIRTVYPYLFSSWGIMMMSWIVMMGSRPSLWR